MHYAREYLGEGRAMQCFLYAAMEIGIIKDKWHQDMPQLFARHDIEIDFEKRGLYNEPHWLIRKAGTLKTLSSNPVSFMCGMGMLSK
jgi:hypothetical protein